VLVFSPHPDDDVISMGGTFIRLCDQGHEVHVAYQTSGNIAVFDDEAERHADFVQEFCRAMDFASGRGGEARGRRPVVHPDQDARAGGQPEVQAIKG
jgi:glucosamine-6-phosphate deaminase